MIRRLFLEEGQIGLSKLVPQDAAWLETWVNDSTTTRWMATGRTQATVDTLAAQIAAWKEPLDWPFAVVAEGQPVGIIGLYGLDLWSGKAEYRVLIGHEFAGRGIGKAATRLILQYGFDRLRLHRIWLGVTAGNVPAILTYIGAGFRPEGVLEDDLIRDGQRLRSLRFGMLDSDWAVDNDRETAVPCRCGCGKLIPMWRVIRGHRKTNRLRDVWAKIPKPKDGCWEWPGPYFSKTGYGCVSMSGRLRSVHRVAYESIFGPTEDLVCHRCDNRKCGRPDHLFEGSHSDNMLDMYAKNRHPRTGGRKPKWDTEKVKPAETSAPGPATPNLASEPSSAFWRQAAV